MTRHQVAGRFVIALCECPQCSVNGSLDAPLAPPVSDTPTPWAVRCPVHKLVYLSHHEYVRQLARPDSKWNCPIEGRIAGWDDDTYEEYLELMSNEEYIRGHYFL